MVTLEEGRKRTYFWLEEEVSLFSELSLLFGGCFFAFCFSNLKSLYRALSLINRKKGS